MIVEIPWTRQDEMNALVDGFQVMRVGDALQVRGRERQLRRAYPQAFGQEDQADLLMRCHARLSAIAQPEDAESAALVADLERVLGLPTGTAG